MSETKAVNVKVSNPEVDFDLLRAQTASRILGSLCVGRSADKQFVRQAVDLADLLIAKLKEGAK